MKQRLLVTLLVLFLLAANNALAKGWISLGIPSIYNFSQADDSAISTESLSGTTSGFMLHGSIFEIPFVGYEKYQISLLGDNSDETTAIIDIEFYDFGLNFEQRLTHFLLGYGYGSIITECKVETCSNTDLEEGIAQQFFAQLGVVLLGKLNFFLSAHRVTGQNSVTTGGIPDRLILDGMMYAFGLKLGW